MENQTTGGITTMPEEKNEYALLQFKRDYSSADDKEGTQKFQKVVFYKLNPDGSYENGTTLEEMLLVSIERLQDLNGRFPCRENSIALTKIQGTMNLNALKGVFVSLSPSLKINTDILKLANERKLALTPVEEVEAKETK